MGDLTPSVGWGLAVGFGFLLDWVAIAMDWRTIKPFTKPLAMVMVILWTAFNSGAAGFLYAGMLLTAQIFGLLGDILLLFPSGAFSAGLSAFLFGHLFYMALLIDRIVGLFKEGISTINYLGWLFLALVVWFGIMLLFYRLFKPLNEQEKTSRLLWVGIQTYAWVLSGMLVLALIAVIISTGTMISRLVLPFGALLFLISDCMLTYNRYIQEFDRAQLWIRITYHLAQFSLAYGFLTLSG